MKISVVVPFVNEQDCLDHCIRSLLDQDFGRARYEIILVDNGSTDGSCDIVRRVQRSLGAREQGPRLTLLSVPRPGSYTARNRGIAAARGEIIAFTDGDCQVARDWLSSIERGLSDPAKMMVVGRRSYAPGSSRALRLLESYEQVKIAFVTGHPRFRRYCFGYTNNMAIRADLFRRIGPFPEVRRGGDTAYVHRYLNAHSEGRLTYLPWMQIQHLEIARVRHWLRKQYIRGRNNRRIARISTYRELPAKLKLLLFGRTVSDCGLDVWDALQLLLWLLAGNLLYSAGGRVTRTVQMVAEEQRLS